jgi:DNA-binding transcriptional ArsR family regulator
MLWTRPTEGELSVLYIHFTGADLTRVRIAAEPDPGWELLLSLHTLGAPGAGRSLPVRRPVAGTVPDPALGMLLELAPPRGYSPDFLTPGGAPDIGSSVDAILTTGRERLRAELSVLAAGRRRPPNWLRAMADGDPEIMTRLGSALRGYHGRILGRRWDRVRVVTAAERAQRVRDLIDGGVERLLGGLHPLIRWEPPVLVVDYPVHQELHLHGRGLLLIPSYFCSGRPITLRDPGLDPVLVYPAARGGHPADRAAEPDRAALARLLGRTRAAVLEDIALSSGTTGGGIARRLGMSDASASEHAAVLRGTGLVETHRVDNRVRHTVTPLGRALLDGRQQPGRPRAPRASVPETRTPVVCP